MGVSFLRPYGNDEIKPNNEIDISHEPLIRCWQKIADDKDGWLQREFRDGLIWKTLRMQAQRGETLSATATAAMVPAVTLRNCRRDTCGKCISNTSYFLTLLPLHQSLKGRGPFPSPPFN